MLTLNAEGLELDGVQFTIAPASLEHRSYIISTWVRGGAQLFKRMSLMVGDHRHPIKRTAYLEEEPGIAERHWDSSYILMRTENPSVCHAWLCGSKGVFLNAYVPPELRRMGIFRALSAHVCGPGQVQMARPWPHGNPPERWHYNPYLSGKL